MEDVNKKGNTSFLDKFKGRTNKIDKNGVNHALVADRTANQADSKDENARFRPKKLASLDTKNISLEYSTRQLEVDNLIPSNPERRHLRPILTKRSTDVSIRSNKLDPINLPLASPLKQIKQTPEGGYLLPPSRSISDKSEGYHRRAFGKFLKLDDEAMRHFEFLLQIDKKRSQRQGSAIFSER